jgi:hypothetical protein
MPPVLRQLIPTPQEIVLAVVASGLMLWHELIWSHLSTGLGWIQRGQQSYTGVARVLHSTAVSWTVLVLFWAVVGLIVYSVVWAVMEVVTEFRNDIIIFRDYTNKGDHTRHHLVEVAQLVIALLVLGLLSVLIVAYQLLFEVTLQHQGAIWQYVTADLAVGLELAAIMLLAWRLIRGIFWLPQLEISD